MPGFDRHAQKRLAEALKRRAQEIGFDACGISRAEQLDEEAFQLEAWLLEGRHATMSWMERNFEKRIDPTKLVPGAQSVVSVLHNYYVPEEHQEDASIGKISRYAWGDDYHQLMKEKLYALFNWLEEQLGEVNGRAFVDSAPVMDKAWAARSGLGWQGKHSNLLNRQMGSWFFIGELIIDVPLPADHPVEDFCGSCTRCIDACPTDAIYEPYAVDANRCISYLTIEHRTDDIPVDLASDMGNWIFGCDVCQDVCPWNKFKYATNEPGFLPREHSTETELREWIELDLATFRTRFENSPVQRPKFEGFMRNVRIAMENAAAAAFAPDEPATPDDA